MTAVDASPYSVTALRRLPRQRNLRVVATTVQDFEPETYDLVNAQYSLPFVPPAGFVSTLERLRESVRPGGVMAVTFFGKHDEWNTPGSQLTFSDRAQIESLFESWELVVIAEEEEDSQTADGTPKHWHVFHVIARRTELLSGDP